MSGNTCFFVLLACASALFGRSAHALQDDYGFLREEVSPVGGHLEVLFEYATFNSRPNRYGESIDAVGDVNGDGFEDFALYDTGIANGVISVFSGADGLSLFTLGGQLFSGVGDIDGDGTDDIASSDFQNTCVYSGADQSLLLDLGWPGKPAPAGDVDGDGVRDILLSVGGHSGNEAWVYSGVDGSRIRTLLGGSHHGYHPYLYVRDTAVLGDLNGDGCDELLIGDRDAANSNGDQNAGIARVYSGQDGSVLFQYEGAYADADFGMSVCSLTDFDGDGRGDFLISRGDFGGSRSDFGGRLFAYSGADGSLLYEIHARSGDRFGAALASVPDLDGDGQNEILVGAPWRSPEPWWWRGRGYSSWQGAAHLYSGATLELLFRMEPESGEPFTFMGRAVAGMQDLTVDGRGEFLVSSFGVDGGLFFLDSTHQALSFNPQLFLSERTLSASHGGVIEVQLDFSDLPAAASQPHKVLLSGLNGGQTDHLGVGVPLAKDALFDRSYQGVYPFPRARRMQGLLDPEGKQTFQLTATPGKLLPAVGRTYSIAAIVEPVAGQAIASSSAVTLEILP